MTFRGACPGVGAVRLPADAPACLVLADVVPLAQRADVRGARAATPGVRDAVIEVASVCRPIAVRERADLVAGHDELGEIAGRPVGAAAVVEQLPGERVGDQPPPGSRLVGCETPGDRGWDRPVAGQ